MFVSFTVTKPGSGPSGDDRGTKSKQLVEISQRPVKFESDDVFGLYPLLQKHPFTGFSDKLQRVSVLLSVF